MNLALLAAPLTVALLLSAAADRVYADKPEVVDVTVTAIGDGEFRINASVLHADTGWDHYANRWDVFTEDGTLLGSRELAHPHETEQPFTRSVTLSIPESVNRILVRAVDSVHGDGDTSFTADVPR